MAKGLPKSVISKALWQPIRYQGSWEVCVYASDLNNDVLPPLMHVGHKSILARSRERNTGKNFATLFISSM